MSQQFSLLRARRFAPLFVTQFLGAFNDNLFKTTLVVMLAYGAIETGTIQPAILVSAAAALFILPFILLSPLAGGLADKYSKTTLTLWIKRAEIIIALVGIAALATASPILSLLTLGALGAQSAFFSPCKYGLLPELLPRDELIAGNALISSGTYIAILLGTIIGALFATAEGGLYIISITLLTCAGIGLYASRKITHSTEAAPSLKISANPFAQTQSLITAIKEQPKQVLTSILAVAWFYFIAATFHAQFPNFAKETLAVNTSTLAFFMIIFSIGIGIGSLLNNKILHTAIKPKWIPLAALGMAIFSADLYFASLSFAPDTSALTTLPQFLSTIAGGHITLDLLGLSIAGGLYIVPLKTIIQDKSNPQNRARVLASSVLLDSVAILSSALIAILLLSIGFKIIELFLTLSAATLLSSLILFTSRQKE